MRIIIVGAGKLGYLVAETAHERHSVVLIEKSPERVQQIKDKVGAQLIVGDACDPSVLNEAGAGHADAVIVVTGHDEDNLVVCALAKYEFNVKKVITRVNNPENGWLYNRTWGVDTAVDTIGVITSLIEEEAGLKDIIALLKLRQGEVSILELALPDGSDIVGKKLMELNLPRESLIAAVLRESTIIVPRGDVTLEKGDDLLVITQKSAEAELLARFQAR
jgi:trk system potassium uptake protein TrkA